MIILAGSTREEYQFQYRVMDLRGGASGMAASSDDIRTIWNRLHE